MKPTERQKAICDAIIREVQWWRDSNDINSPTHYSDLEDCLRADLDDEIGESERYMLQQKLIRVFEIIKRNKD